METHLIAETSCSQQDNDNEKDGSCTKGTTNGAMNIETTSATCSNDSTSCSTSDRNSRLETDDFSSQNEGQEEDKNEDSKSDSKKKKANFVEGEYMGKKPKWWVRVAGRRGSKQQRWALQHLTTNHNYWSASSTITSTATNDYQERCLEIGCGQGHILLENAKNNPHRLYIGADIHKPALGALLLRIHDNQDETTDLFKNVIVYGGDGMQWLRPKHILHQQEQNNTNLVEVPENWLHHIYVTFPDPFPKHHQYRILQKQSLKWMHRVLQKNNGCVFVATDDENFAHWSQSLFASFPTDWSPVLPCPPRSSWLPIISTYEQKGLDEGRTTHLQCWKCITKNEE